MTNLSFKTPLYRLYAPYRFKLVSWLTKKRLKNTNANISEACSMVWDRFLAKKFLAEAKTVGGIASAKLPWKKQSETLFILGCGSSVNLITPEEWALISEHDSIGVNYFYFHEFKPSAHFIELGKSKEAFDALHQYLLNDSKRNEPVFMQIRHLIKNNIQLNCPRERVRLYSPTTMKSRNFCLLKDYLSRFYMPFRNTSPLIHHSSTLDCVINFGIRQKYKKICLVGVDLNNNKYFWDEAPTTPKYQKAIDAVDADYKIGNWERNSEKQHATVDKNLASELNCLSLIEYLKLLNETVLTGSRTKISIGNEASLLTEIFPYQSIVKVLEVKS